MGEVADSIEALGVYDEPVSEVVVRGSYLLAAALDEAVGSDVEVDNYSMDFRTFLDDEGESSDGSYEEESSDGSDDGTVEAVRQEGQKPIVAAVAQVHDLSVNDIETFDLQNRDDRGLVNYEVLQILEDEDDLSDDEVEFGGSDRITRAKAKSMGKASERLLSDHFDNLTTVDHAVIVEDGSDAYEHVSDDVRGTNKWVKYPSEIPGHIHCVRGGDAGDSIDWPRYLAETEDPAMLGDEQEADLRERLSADELEEAGLEVERSAEPVEDEASFDEEGRPTVAEAAAIAGRSADD